MSAQKGWLVVDMQEMLMVLLIVFVVVALCWRALRSRHMLRRWAAANGFQILRYERRWLRRGAFFGRASRAQDVFYVVLLDRHGCRRLGWVRVGGWFTGVFANQVDVRWVMPGGPGV